MIDGLHQGDVEIVEDSTAYSGFFKLRNIKLKHKLFQGGWSETFDRELCVRGDAVGVLLFDPQEDKFALVEQLRIGALNRPVSPWLLELVAGMLDKEGEDKTELAKRETLEESGLEVLALEPMLEYFCSPGGSTEFFSLYCAKVDLKGVEPAIFGLPEEHENIKLHVLETQHVLDMLEQGKINNAMTIIALQWFQLHKDKLLALWC